MFARLTLLAAAVFLSLLASRLLGESANDFPAQSGSLSKMDLDSLWSDLAGSDAMKAYRAIGALADAPGATLPYFKEHLQPVKAPEAKRLNQLLKDLESQQFATRDQATRELEKLADLAEPAIRKLLAGEVPLEVRQRAEGLIKKLEGPISTPESLRAVRAVEVLERIGNEEARALLRTLTTGAEGALLTRESNLALKRLGR